jgi:hypothetical protein
VHRPPSVWAATVDPWQEGSLRRSNVSQYQGAAPNPKSDPHPVDGEGLAKSARAHCQASGLG